MKKAILTVVVGLLSLPAAFGQGQRQGPGVQAAQDPREPAILAQCKNPPAARGGLPGAGAGARRGAPPPAPEGPREYTVKEIPGVIAAGQQWKMLWQVDGNNADGIITTKDGAVLIAQNDSSAVLKLDKNGKTSVVYKDTNTGGALSMNSKGALFVAERGVNPAIWELAPKRQALATRYQDDPLDCLGGVMNDLTADSKGGAYFTMNGLYYASPAGVVTKYGEDLRTNGVILSPDEKTLYVTNGPALAAFDVQRDGSLTNQREFVKLEGGGDGATVDSTGRIYVTGGPGVQVVSPDGKYLGAIPTPRNVISAAFGGPDKKTLYAVVSYGPRTALHAQIISIQMLAQGYKGRAK